MTLSPKSRTIFRLAAVPALAALALPSIAAPSHGKHAAKAHKHKSKPAAKVASKERADPALAPVVGTWYVNQNGAENRAQRLAFSPNGTFAFMGSGWKSRGQYKFKDNMIALVWTEVDGSRVKLGSMHKDLALGADGMFKVDRYQYAKHVEVAAQQ